MRKFLLSLTILFSFSSFIKAELLITQANVHIGDGASPFTADILIRDGIIQKIASNISPQSNWEVLEANGLNVTPGLISPTSNIGIYLSDRQLQLAVNLREEGADHSPILRTAEAR